MEKRYTIHGSIYVVKQFVFSVAYCIIVASWLFPFYLQVPYNLYRSNFIRFALFLSITMVVILLLSRTVFHILKNTAYIVTDTHLIKKTPLGTLTILLSAVTSFRYHHYPLGFGYASITVPGKTLRFTYLIENLAEMAFTLKHTLDQMDKSSVYNEKEIDTFQHQAHIGAFMLEQTFQVFYPLIYSVAGIASLGLITAFILWQLPLLFALVWMILSGLFPCVGFLVAYVLITRSYSRHLLQGINNAMHDRISRIYALTIIGTLCIYLLSGIVYKNIWHNFWW